MVAQPKYRREPARIRSLAIPNYTEQDSGNFNALYEAVKSKEHDRVRNLLGVYAHYTIELADSDGCKLLYIAAASGCTPIVELLLQHGANVESFNNLTKCTTLYQAVEGETTNVDGFTPLFAAVMKRDLHLAELLLRRGASKAILLNSGKAVDLLVEGDNELKELLRSHQAYEELHILNSNERASKVFACHEFEVNIVDFFVADREQRVHVTKPIYEILYGATGPQAIMDKSYSDNRPRLRWYHLPANNMEWVEALTARILQDRGITLISESRSNLSLTNSARRQYCTTTAHSTFMRPICRAFEQPVSKFGMSSDTLAVGEQVMIFMARAIRQVRERQDLSSPQACQIDQGNANSDEKVCIENCETMQKPTTRSRLQISVEEILHQLTRSFKNMRKGRSVKWEANTGDHDMEKGAHCRNFDNINQNPESEPINGLGVKIQRASETTGKDTNVADENIHSLGNQRTFEIRPESYRKQDAAIQPSISEQRGIDEHGGGVGDAVNAGESLKPEEMTPDECLINGYLPLGISERIPSIQVRRTLDQYFYTHLEISENVSHSTRDNDQIVYRFTKNSSDPKMFMVDQLWLWIINDDTVISCFPQRWDAQNIGLPNPHDSTARICSKKTITQENPNHTVNNNSNKNDVPTSNTESLHNKPSDFDGGNQFQVPRDKSPLDVHQMILRHLQKSSRPSIESAYQLAKLITDMCANVFNPHEIPDEFQFFEFFERSIGSLIDKEAKCYLEFAHTLDRANAAIGNPEKPSFNITAETHLLVEIKDIRDELGILRMVLTDQLNVMNDFASVVARGHARVQESIQAGKIAAMPETKPDVNQSLDKPELSLDLVIPDEENNGNRDKGKSQSGEFMVEKNKVIENHLHRIDHMDQLAEKTYIALNHLLDLKQKQANISEADSANRQATESLELARFAQVQADQGSQQGKTLMIFTVVTILFLPLSFVAAFFAIEMDKFPLDHNGKLPMSYVLKYMLGTSFAVSVPLILLAFNHGRVSRWLATYTTRVANP
ncbi:uncharacterized protein EAE98_002853 [Botrytis deweyae]|uniref:Uncharacterized protein n=1 Tax=Botrytis deweyae TaxID=2478750 RepID=A0ABQ7IUY7_9HELO|nr:uncharacterized protein EAE98_002853 [Botrytis deweyae]KAF7934808.1 hypothetical protein EAE98_002853 [Botrytis deweyae]